MNTKKKRQTSTSQPHSITTESVSDASVSDEAALAAATDTTSSSPPKEVVSRRRKLLSRALTGNPHYADAKRALLRMKSDASGVGASVATQAQPTTNENLQSAVSSRAASRSGKLFESNNNFQLWTLFFSNWIITPQL